MTLALGIDTGGTYTDAALVKYETGAARASAKALTIRCNLGISPRLQAREHEDVHIY